MRDPIAAPLAISPVEREPSRTLASDVLGECLQIVPTLDLRDIGARLLAPLVAATHAHRASLMIVNPDSGRLRIVAGLGIPPELIGKDAEWRPNSIAEWVFRRREGLALQGEVHTEALQGSGDGSVDASLCVPLEGTNGTLGVVNLARRAPEPSFSDAERESIEQVLPPLAAALERAIRAQRAERYVGQLDASAVMTLVPTGQTQLRHHELGLAHAMSENRAGDAVERVLHGNGAHSLLVTDASGDGVDAAIATAFVRGSFVAGASPERTLSGLVAQLNASLHARAGGAHSMALWAAVLSPSGQLSTCNAGYPAPLWVPSDDSPVCRLAGGGQPVGADAQGRWDEEQVRMLPGDLVLVVSDALLDARNVMNAPFGEERVIEVATEFRREPLDRLAQAMIERVLAYSGRPVPVDDLQILAIRFAPER